MAPNTTIAPPPSEELEKKATAAPAPVQAPRAERKTYIASAQNYSWLAESLLENSDTRPKRQTLDMVLSLVVHSLVLGTMILLPLFFTEAIDLRQFTTTFLVAPPPPPPPPPPPTAQPIVKVSRPRPAFLQSGKLVAPTAIPEKVAMLKESDMAPDIGGGVVGGVPGGVPGGQAGGVIGGILSNAPRSYIPPAPTTAAPKAPIRVGGRVMAPRAISAPDPIYPPLAKQARISGDVVIDAVIDVKGNVVEMQVVSGHPLLVPSALEALRRWKYQPTILNDEPVPVQLLVTIRFRMQ